MKQDDLKKVGILSVIISFLITFLINLSPMPMASYTGGIKPENYQILKDYAMEIASNSDTEAEDGLKVTKNLTRETLIVDIDASLYGIEAIFPISNYNEIIENGKISFEGVIEYDNVVYSEHTDVAPPVVYIMGSIILFTFLSYMMYFLLYAIKNCSDQNK